MIRLHSLNMSRFRGIREGSIQGFADINLLVGRNNSGKTTVLEAIQRLGFGITGGGADLLGRKITNLWSGFRNENLEFPPDLWYRQDQLREIACKAELTDDATGKKAFYSWGVRKEGATPKPFGSFDGTLQPASSVLNRMTLFRPQDIPNRDIENKLWSQVLAGRGDKALTSALNEIFGLEAEGFQLMPTGQLMVLFPDYATSLDLQGDGTRAAFRAMIVLSLIQKTLFMMEEPECHQHPGSLQRLAKAICTRAKEQELQILITTHSAECVRSFLEAATTAGSEGAVFHLALDNGVLQARRLDPEAVETLTTTGVDVRFLDLYA